MDIVAVKDSELERYVTKIMLEIGVPAHLKGYHYLRDAIILSGKDMEVVSSVTKLLYPTIAKHFKTTDQKVERAMSVFYYYEKSCKSHLDHNPVFIKSVTDHKKSIKPYL